MSDTTRGKRELSDWVKTTKEKIEVKGGFYLRNFRCHENSVHFARKHNEDKIAMVMYQVDKEDPILHFVNINKEGLYIDNTLGELTQDNEDYYLLKIIKEEEFTDILTIFRKYLDYTKTKVSWWARFRSGSERLC